MGNTIAGTGSIDRTNIAATNRLAKAVSDGNLLRVKRLVEGGKANVHAADEGAGSTLLHVACFTGRLEVAQYLVETCSVDTKATNINGLSALHQACMNGHVEMVKYLMKNCSVDVEAKDKNGVTPLLMACYQAAAGPAVDENRRLEIVQYLIESGQANVLAVDNRGGTLLHWATVYGYLSIVQYLVQTCSQKLDVKGTDTDGSNALHHAAFYGHLDIVVYLVEQAKLNVNAKRKTLTPTALHAACYMEHVDIVRYLMEEADCAKLHRKKGKSKKRNTKSDTQTIMELAESQGHSDVVDYLYRRHGFSRQMWTTTIYIDY